MGTLISAVCAFAISGIVVAASLRYAHRRGLLDHPGQRRSHTQPTPRGGGIGIVVATLACGMPALAVLPQSISSATVAVLALSLIVVAAIGWLDDHRPLPVLPRIGVHLLASLAAAAILLAPVAQFRPQLWWSLIPIALIFVGSINAHNFMDGIDGLLGLQGMFVFAGYAVLAYFAGQTALTAATLAIAAACLGFLCFNRPPARIFMGDVGSGALGLLSAAFAGLLVQHAFVMLWPCAILSSAFIVDSALTLIRRVSGGRRWYTAHREHLYQWMARAGWSHARTDVMYLTWNLIIAAPAAWAATRWPASAPALCAAVCACGAIAWWIGKRVCFDTVRRSGRHATA